MDFKKMSDFNAQNNTRTVGSSSSAQYDQGLRSYMLKIYNYMALALVLTGVTAYGVSSSPELMNTIFGSPLKWVVMIAPLGFIMVMSFGINKLSFGAAQGLFWAFAAVMGVSLSSILMVYTGQSVARAFFITSATFASVSLYGYTTKKDLSGMGSFLFMGVIGLIIASVVNIFMQSSALQFAISALTVVIFTGLTAYDTQRLKNMYYQLAGNAEAMGKASIMGALSLYINFINIFISLLQLFGERR
jgi:FtsH-binding integral membrane protein